MSILQLLTQLFPRNSTEETNSKWIFHVKRRNKDKICVHLYGHETLADLHMQIRAVIFPHYNMGMLDSVSIERAKKRLLHFEDSTSKRNKNKSIILSTFIDLFVVCDHSDEVLSIPNNAFITLVEFIENNKHFFPLVKSTDLICSNKRMVYKLYIMEKDIVMENTYMDACVIRDTIPSFHSPLSTASL